MVYRIKTNITSNRLSFVLLLYILLSSALFTFLASGFQLYQLYRRDMRKVQDVFSQIERSYLAPIAASLWSYDTQQMETQIQGLLNLPSIVKAEIRDVTGSQGRPIVTLGDIHDRRFIEKSYTLNREGLEGGMAMGTLTVYAGLDWIKDNVIRQAFSTILMKVVEISILSMCILIIFHHLIMKHLTRIAQFFRTLDINKLDVRLSLERKSSENKDILDFMVEAINGINEYLAADIARRTEAEEKLRRINEDLEISKREIEEQSRNKTRQMMVSDILREEEHLGALASRLVSYLCDVMGAGVGLFYYVDERDGMVRAVGTFAADGSDLLSKVFPVGEGLVGQAVRSRRMMTLDTPGDTGLVVKSALGFSKPSHILIFPFERKGRVTAVFEAGGFHPFPRERVHFLEQIEERVAVATEAAVYRGLMGETKDSGLGGKETER